MTYRLTAISLLGIAALAVGAPARARAGQAATHDADQFFEARVRPLLLAHCTSCHGATSQSGGLRLDSAEAFARGGKDGPVAVGGNTDGSLLIRAVRYSGAIRMPPGGPLAPADVATLEEWVRLGARWPAAQAPAKGAGLWSLQPVRRPPMPAVHEAAWTRTPVDRFILARLEKAGLHHAAPADRRTLLRRVTYDLTGLPPTAAETAAFLADRSAGAYERVVARLLASPRYGERYGRHWLDVARYADTKGYVGGTEDTVYHFAWTYRDWVIRAFNENLPYNRFVEEQLAADQLPGAQRPDQAALGFLRVGRRFINDQTLIIDDRIDVTCRGLMAFTVGCARCHDHKFDPIPTADYYSLSGVFASLTEPQVPLSPDPVVKAWNDHQDAVNRAQGGVNGVIIAQCDGLRDGTLKPPQPLPADLIGLLRSAPKGAVPPGDLVERLEPSFTADARAKLAAGRAELERLSHGVPPEPVYAMAVSDIPTPVEPHILARGNPAMPGAAVPRRFLAALSGPDRKPFSHGSGRLDLAEAIADPANPLTARVFVNRIWQWHFGYGLVRTPGDFGTRGDPPTHPELLDWLASDFVAHGWDVKRLNRIIVTSAVYMQRSEGSAAAERVDPENRLLWRQNRERLDWEELRDSVLAASGKLDLALGGPSVDLLGEPFTDRRTVYGFTERQNLPGLFRAFDAPNPDITTAQRSETVVPQQALFMMNSPFIEQNAAAAAGRCAAATPASAVGRLYASILGRQPTPAESAICTRYLRAVSGDAAGSPWSYGYGAIDEQAGRVRGFVPFAHFTGRTWQPGEKLPDPVLGYVNLAGDGGHPGNDAQHCAVRRWTAPADGAVTVRGTLKHPSTQGDGVIAYVVASRTGIAGRWAVHGGSADTACGPIPVRKGDTIDFVVSCGGGPAFDSFAWAPQVAMGAAGAWNAAADFHGPEPAVTPLQRLAHALLMSNEFDYVD